MPPQLNIYEDLKYYRSTTLLSFYYVRPGSDGAPCVEAKLSSTKVRQTFELLRHLTKTAVPN